MKLVRDRIPELYPENTYARVLPDDRQQWLIRKLFEEATEVMLAEDGESMAEELADLAEVIYALLNELGVSRESFELLREAKTVARGGYYDSRLLVALAR